MRLRMELRSDSAFGRGDGIAGLVDSEVEHDARTGLPYIKGRTVKGLLVESCADLLYALESGGNPASAEYVSSAKKLFGVPGSTLEDTGCLHIGPALLPDDLRQRVRSSTRYSPQQILEAFTTIRHQTAIDETRDTPKDGSLRATRVILRDTFFYSNISTIKPLTSSDLQLLAACAAGIKRGGLNRTRGLGWLHVELIDVVGDPLMAFINRIGGAA